MQPPKGKFSDLTQLATLQLTDDPVLHVLTGRVSKLEEETDSSLTTVSAELKLEFSRLGSCLTNLCKTTDNGLHNQYREIGSLSNDLFALPSRVVKIKYDFAHGKVTLDSQ